MVSIVVSVTHYNLSVRKGFPMSASDAMAFCAILLCILFVAMCIACHIDTRVHVNRKADR